MNFNKKINRIAGWIKRFRKTSICIVFSVVFSAMFLIYGFISDYSFSNSVGDIRLLAEDIISVAVETLRGVEDIDETTKDTNKGVDVIIEEMKELTKIDCCKLDELWEIIGNAVIEDKYFILDEGEIRGTIRLRKPLYNLFILEIVFIPFSDKNTDTIFAFKDKNKNELILTISDGDESIKLAYREEGEITSVNNEKNIISGIERGKEIKLRIETLLKPKSIFTSAMFSYVPTKKPDERITEDIDIEVPYDFKSGDFNLHIGLKGSEVPEENIKLDIVSCLIREKPKAELSW